jgi:hypothetical protein
LTGVATELDWHHEIRDLLDERIARRDVWVMLRVRAERDVAPGSLDADSFLERVSSWIATSVDAGASSLHTVGSDTWAWTTDGSYELHINLTLLPRTYPVGHLVGNPEPAVAAAIGCPNCASMNTAYYASAMSIDAGDHPGEYSAYRDYLARDDCRSGFTREPGANDWVPAGGS